MLYLEFTRPDKDVNSDVYVRVLMCIWIPATCVFPMVLLWVCSIWNSLGQDIYDVHVVFYGSAFVGVLYLEYQYGLGW